MTACLAGELARQANSFRIRHQAKADLGIRLALWQQDVDGIAGRKISLADVAEIVVA